MTPPLATGMPQAFRRATSHRDAGYRFENETGRFRFRENIRRRTRQRRSFSLKGIGSISSEPTSCDPRTVALERQSLSLPRTRQFEATSCLPDHRDTGSSCRPRIGRRATDLPMVCVPYRLGWAGGRPHRQDYPKCQGQSLGWPHCQLHQHCFEQRSRPRRAPRRSVCRERELFSFDVGSLSNSGLNARFSTYHLSVNLSKSKL